MQLSDGQFKFGAMQSSKDAERYTEIISLELSENRALHIEVKHIKEMSVQPLIQDMLIQSAKNKKPLTVEQLQETLDKVVGACTIKQLHLNQIKANDIVPFFILLQDAEGVFSVESIAHYDTRIVLMGERRSISLDVEYIQPPNCTPEQAQVLSTTNIIDILTSLFILKRGGSLIPLHLGDFKDTLSYYGIKVNYVLGAVL